MTTESLPDATPITPPRPIEPPAALRATGVVLVLAVVISIVAIAFALPAARSKPHDVPIGVAGPQAASGQVADMLEQHAPGAFEITYYPGEAALRDAIRNRDVYGGISFGPDGRTLLIATGASPTVAQLLTQVGNGIAQHAGAAAAHRRPRPADRRRPARRRSGGVRAADHPGRTAARDRARARAAARGVDPVRRRGGVRWAGRLRRSPLLLRFVLGSIDANFWGVAGGLDARRYSPPGCRCWASARCSAASAWPSGALLALLLGNPLSGLTQRARASAQRMGRRRSVVAAGGERHAAAFDGVLRRCRARRWRSSC